MKKTMQFIVATLTGVLLLAVPASAQTIENGNGTGSNNTITNSNSFECDVDNSNNIDVTVDSDQNASSGSAEANNNTTVGNVSTGDASNTSNINTSITVSNGPNCLPHISTGGNGGGNVPTNGGQGGGGGSVQAAVSGGRGGVVMASGVRVAALPATGETAPAEVAALGTAILSGMALILRFGYSIRNQLT